MTNTRHDIVAQITENLDLRRLEITNVRRILLNHVGKTLEGTAVRMAVPMVYAHWEGYVKEACQLYLEYIEGAVATAGQLQPAILGYLWTPTLRPITGGLSFERRKAVAECALSEVGKPIRFGDAEKTIKTSSNLNFSVLKRIANDLCLDINSLVPRKRYLNAFVHMRNNIAHGSRPQTLRYSDFDRQVQEMLALMEDFEQTVLKSLRDGAFLLPMSYRERKRAARRRDNS